MMKVIIIAVFVGIAMAGSSDDKKADPADDKKINGTSPDDKQKIEVPPDEKKMEKASPALKISTKIVIPDAGMKQGSLMSFFMKGRSHTKPGR